jgi:ubiquinone/menaquinone biosynthesis C-methylase UbiE
MLSATFYDIVMARAEKAALGAWRGDLLKDARGDVLEIGAGTGANLRHYPPEVTGLILTEPDPGMRARLVAQAGPSILVGDCPAQALAVADASVDTVVCTLVLCTVPDVAAVLAEIRRVLRPNGELLLIEHVAAASGTVTHRAQRLLTPVWSRLAGGCCLQRDTAQALTRAGFDTSRLQAVELPVPLPIVRAALWGRAPCLM